MYAFIKSSALMVSLLSLFASPTNTTTNWKLEKDEEGIQVFTRMSESSPIKEFKAITTTTQSLENLEKILDDVKNYPKWQQNVSSTSILKKVDEHTHYIYFTTELPWPIDSRDIVSSLTKKKMANGSIVYRYESIAGQVKEKENYVRVKNAKGSWELTPQGNNSIKITYQSIADPGGSLPNWLINSLVVNGPFDTLKKLKTL